MNRLFQHEEFDNLDLHGPDLHRSLRELSFINQYFGSRSAIISGVRKFLHNEKDSLTILDLGCGGGDILIHLARWMDKNKQPARFIGIDGNPHSLEYARNQCSEGLDITWLQADILAKEFEIPPCDIVVSSHFLYHLPEDDLVRFLKKHKESIRKGWVISEIIRSRIAVYGFYLISLLVGMSGLTRSDGMLAVRRAMLPREWRRTLQQLTGRHVIRRRWMFRQQIIIDYS